MEKGKQTYRLPEGWVWTTIGEVGIVQSGGTPSTRNNEFWGDEIFWITPADLSGYNKKYISKGSRSLSKIGLDYSSAKLLPKGTILFSSRAPIGYTVIAKNELATNQGFKNLIPTKSLNSEYVYYYFQTLKSQAEKVASGTTFLELSATKFSLLPFPLAPLEEQQRIVLKIESLLSEHNEAEKGLQRAKKQLEIYKQALLKNAFKGRLTEQWRKENSTGTFKEPLSKDNLMPYKWKYTKIENISSFIGSGSTPKGGRNVYKKEGIPFIRSQNIYPNSFLQDDLVFISESINLKMKRTQTQPKDVLLNITGASIGRCAYIPENFKEGNVNQHVCIIRTIPEYINYKYLTYLLNSPEIQSLIKKINSGATREALNLAQIRNIDIPICNVQEQEQVVLHLDSKFTLIKNLEDSINKELLNLEKLKHSILNEAFNGKLVPQNENEESAFNLLNQIKTEKALYLKKIKSEKMKTSSKNKSSIKKKTLLELLKEEYSDTEFSFEDIRNLSNMSYEDLKTELYLLLDKNKELEIVFNKSVKKILYKIKS